MILRCHGQLDAECSACSRSRLLHEDAPAVVLLYYSFCKRETEPPATAFCCVAGIENRLLILAADAFACI